MEKSAKAQKIQSLLFFTWKEISRYRCSLLRPIRLCLSGRKLLWFHVWFDIPSGLTDSRDLLLPRWLKFHGWFVMRCLIINKSGIIFLCTSTTILAAIKPTGLVEAISISRHFLKARLGASSLFMERVKLCWWIQGCPNRTGTAGPWVPFPGSTLLLLPKS